MKELLAYETSPTQKGEIEDQGLNVDKSKDDPELNKFEMDCYNLYLLLDEVNDGAINYSEIKDSCLKQQQGLLDKWQETYPNNKKVLPQDFLQFLEKNYSLEVVNEILYQQYGKALKGCCCFRFCCRKIRAELIKSEFVKFKTQLDSNFMKDRKPLKKSLKEKAIEIVLKSLKLQSHFSQLFDFIGDMLILWLVYQESREIKNFGKTGYLIVIVVNLICGLSTFLISYSSMLNMALSEGIYEPLSMLNAKCYQKLLRYLFLSFIGPIFPIFISCVSFIEYFALIFLLLCGQKGVRLVNRTFTKINKKLFGLSRRQMEGLEAQTLIAQLLFESLPMLILKTFMILGYLDINLDDEDNQNQAMLVILSFSVAILNMLNTFLKIWVESRAFQEPFILYVLNSLKAQHGWIPFNHMFKKGVQLGLNQNYSEIKIKYPIITNMTGYYQKVNFQFESASLQEFSTQLVLYSNNLLTNGLLEEVNGPPKYVPYDEQPKKEQSILEKIPKDYIEHYQKLFDKFDLDKDGFITKGEIIEYLNDKSYDAEEEAEEFFDKFDLNKDGKVSFEEFATINAEYDHLKNQDYDYGDEEEEEEKEQVKEVFYFTADKVTIGCSISKVSINLAIHTYDITRLPGINVDFTGVNWNNLIENSYELNTITQSETNQSKKQAYTISGKPCIWICVDWEPSESQKEYYKPFDLKDCMKLLLEHKIDTDIMDASGETLLIHAIKTNKQISIDLLIQNGTNIHLANKNGMTPLGQSIKDNKFDLIKQLINLGAKVHEPCIKDIAISNKLCTPIEYLAKKMKKDKRFVNKKDAKKLIELFYELNIKAETEQEKIAIFKYVSQNFNAPKHPYEFSLLLKKKLFNDLDVLTMNDLKGNNFAHQLVKNWTDLTTEYNIKNHLYYFTEKESMFGQLVWTVNKADISPIEKLMKSEKYQSDIHFKFVTTLMVLSKLAIPDDKTEQKVIDFLSVKLKDDFAGKKKTKQKIEAFQELGLRGCFKDKIRYDAMIDAANEIANQEWVPQVQTQDQTNTQQPNEENDADTTQQQVLEVDNGEQLIKQEENVMSRKANPKFNNSLIAKCDVTKEAKKVKQSGIEAVFKYSLELIGLCDLIGDFYCLTIYVASGHYAWAALTIFQMLSPFFISYVPLVNYWIHLGSFGIYQHGKKEISKCKKIFGYMALFPIFLVYLTVMDLLYLIETVFLRPISVFLGWISCGYCKLTVLSNTIESLYSILFDMGENDIEGFRRLRTISQLLFESIPQILLQIRMVHYFLVEHYDPKELERIGVDFGSIGLSLLFAVIHVIIELQFLALDAKACKTTKMHYIIICLNGRFGWVPFTHKFLSSNLRSQDKKELLDYDDIQSSLCGMKLKVFFKFDESTCDNLIKAISSLPIEKQADKRFDIKIGNSIDEVSFESFINLLDIGYNRVNLNIDDVNIRYMIEQSVDYQTPITDKMDIISQDMNSKWDKIMERMVTQGYCFMVMMLVKLGVSILDNDAAVYYRIAMDQKDGKMVQTLLRLNKKQVFDQSYIYLQRFIKRITDNNPNASQIIDAQIQQLKQEKPNDDEGSVKASKQDNSNKEQQEEFLVEAIRIKFVYDELMKLDSSVTNTYEDVENLYWYMFMTNLGNLTGAQFFEFMKEQVRKINIKTVEIKMKAGWYIDGFIFCNQQGQELHSREVDGGNWGKGIMLAEGEYCVKFEQWADDEDHLMRALFTMSTGRTHDFKGSKYGRRDKQVETFQAPEGQFIASVTQTGYCGSVKSADYESF